MWRTFLLLTCVHPAFAQFQVIPSTEIPVYHGNGTPMLRPWTGGVNAAHLSMFDADADGFEDDIFLFDKAGNRILIFTSEIVNGQQQFLFQPSLTAQFPALKDWALLRDFNCDGKRDIFSYSPLGGSIAVHQNMTVLDGELSFESVNQSIQSLYPLGTNPITTNVYVSSQDIPGIFDFEGDGDLDLLVFTLGGSTLEFHENFSVDNGGNCGLGDYVLRNRCYGKFAEGTESNNINLGAPCSFNVADPKSGAGNRHVGSTILAFDATQDGLADIVLGDVTYTNLVYLENSEGTIGEDSIVAFSNDFPSDFGGPPVDLDNFPGAFYEDFNGDGVRDLAVGVNSPSLSRNMNSIWFYENIGLDDAPVFSFIQTDFLQDEMIDLGEVSAPAMFDYNGDGLLDIVIGSRGEFEGGSAFHQRLDLYLNVGTASDPAYKSEIMDWLSVSDIGIDQYVHPTFGDLDGDGDMEMILGDATGKVFLFENVAGAGSTAGFNLIGALSANGAVIDVEQNSTPQLFDLDQDGLLDLIIGERNGNLNYYRNAGSATSANFDLVTENLGGVSTVEPFYFIGSSAPHFYRIDGTTHLAAGAESGNLHHFSNIDGNLTGNFTLESLTAFGVKMGAKSRLLVTDLNMDGDMDLLVGGVGGGLSLYLGSDPVGIFDQAKVNDLFEVFPNPGNNALHIRIKEDLTTNAYFNIYSLSGVLLLGDDIEGQVIDVSSIASGTYLLTVNSNTNFASTLWIKK